MNPIFRAAAESTDLGWLMALTTVFFVATFLMWVVWTLHPALRERMEVWGRMPLDDGEDR